MIGTQITFSPNEIPFCEKEILRYAGVKKPDESLNFLMRECMEEIRPLLDFRVCYKIFPLTLEDGVCGLQSKLQFHIKTDSPDNWMQMIHF